MEEVPTVIKATSRRSGVDLREVFGTAKKKRKPAKRAAVSTERMDLRLPKRLKVKVYAKAKQQRRTVTSVIVELIEKMK